MSYVAIADGSVRWVHQLTGEWQRSPDGSRIHTLSRTRSNYGIDGTDLGASFFDGERLWFLFGDTWPDHHLDDSFASTTDTDPDAGLTLKFLGANRSWKRPNIFQGPNRLSTGAFEVPTGGFALGGRRYVIFTGRHYEKAVDGEKRQVMGSSALCRQRDGGADLADLQVVFELSDETAGGRFINASPLVVPHPPPGLTFDGPAVLVWGSGTYRHSHCYLAAVSAAVPAPPQVRPVEDRSQWRYLGRIRDDGTPDWISEQHQAMSLFAPPDLGGDGGIGELSVAWIEPLRVWMLAYGYHRAPGELDRMVFRTAPRPWGPWSPPQLLDNVTEPAMVHGTFMHKSWDAGGIEGTDQLYDRGRGMEWGAPYAPYLIDRFTRPAGPNRAQIWFTLSSWNPYQAHLMTAVLERRPGDVVVHPDAPFVPPGDVVVHPDAPFVPPGDVVVHPDAPFVPPGDVVVHPDAPFVPPGGPASPRGGVSPLGGGGDHLDPGGPPGAGLLGGGHDRIRLDPPRLPRGAGHERIDLDAPPIPVPTGGLSMIRSRFGPAGNNFELITPMLSGGLSFVAAQNDPWPPAWGPAVPVGRMNVPCSAGSIALAVTPDHRDAPEDHVARRDRLVVAATSGDRVVYYFRDPKPPWHWSGPYPVIAVDPDTDIRTALPTVRGNPALVGSTFGGQKANIELFVPDAVAGVRHFWFDNDPHFPLSGEWMVAPNLGTSLGQVDAVGAMQSVFGDAERGNLEVVVRRGGELHLFWRDATMAWQGPFPLVADGQSVTNATGIPALLQSRYGQGSNDFQLVIPWRTGGLAYFRRDNSAADPTHWRWNGPAVIDPAMTYAAASLVAGPFGPAPGNLELVATASNGTIRHFYREAAGPAWHDAGTVPI